MKNLRFRCEACSKNIPNRHEYILVHKEHLYSIFEMIEEQERELVKFKGIEKPKIAPPPCKLHAYYKGDKRPRRTKKNPKGCPRCWDIYNYKNPITKGKADVKKKGRLDGNVYEQKVLLPRS